MLGEIHAEGACVEQIEQLEFFAVIRAGGVPERRPDPAVLLGKDLLWRSAVVDTPFATHHLMQVGGERLGEPVS